MPRNDLQPSHPIYRAKRRRRHRRRLKRHYRIFLFVLVLLLIVAVLNILFAKFFNSDTQQASVPSVADASVEELVVSSPPAVLEASTPVYTLSNTENTISLDTEIQSEYAVLIELDTGTVVARKSAESRINPASMTKVLTLLVAAEQITGTDGTFTMTREIADYCYTNECSVVGYEVGEEIPIIELFYGCILCSGADACLALAELASGSHDAFVDLMNMKIQELGLAETTHFTNCVGIYDEEHYCTVEDMALIMKAAMENDFCKSVLSTAVYTSESTDEHPEGQVLSNWFIRRIEDQETGDITVSCGKTGYVPESGNCAVSYGEDSDGNGYICVTGNGSSSWQVIYDHIELYNIISQYE